MVARIILVYIGTPMVAGKRWKKSDIERIEVQLYREVHRLTNLISNKAVMNLAFSLRSAWEIVQPLAERAKLQPHHQEKIPFIRSPQPVDTQGER